PTVSAPAAPTVTADTEVKFAGHVMAYSGSSITVGTRTAAITGATEIKGKIVLNAIVQVEAVSTANGLVAREIRLLTTAPADAHPTPGPQGNGGNGADDGANHDQNDDNGGTAGGNGADDGANHDQNDDNGGTAGGNGADDGANHDQNDDNGGSSGGTDDNANHDQNDDNGGSGGGTDDGANHDQNDDHGGSSGGTDDNANHDQN
ncbi:hypothetical protein SE17_42415, partial [Kouleothrix aurantiaca]